MGTSSISQKQCGYIIRDATPFERPQVAFIMIGRLCAFLFLLYLFGSAIESFDGDTVWYFSSYRGDRSITFSDHSAEYVLVFLGRIALSIFCLKAIFSKE